ncbi:unnamed protein product [Vitrella brassicaformis CCMP3155]|uniref:Uncharacterized protein n=1 Tax=Vitrella brassicaformis (strain CCMP3155) TaxID=1169540 RepID=A0A0G4FEY6_VITBC|nr:unnamed protein product [Vitrella brassicaformis CCMP3155]|eukprot:CEM11584.1 unnamed protein product [Vitrella brassicaformis CCMP3155]
MRTWVVALLGMVAFAAAQEFEQPARANCEGARECHYPTTPPTTTTSTTSTTPIITTTTPVVTTTTTTTTTKKPPKPTKAPKHDKYDGDGKCCWMCHPFDLFCWVHECLWDGCDHEWFHDHPDEAHAAELKLKNCFDLGFDVKLGPKGISIGQSQSQSSGAGAGLRGAQSEGLQMCKEMERNMNAASGY